MRMNGMSKPKESKSKPRKPILKRVYVKERSTGKILIEFIPTRAGVNQANRYKGLADLDVVQEYYE